MGIRKLKVKKSNGASCTGRPILCTATDTIENHVIQDMNYSDEGREEGILPQSNDTLQPMNIDVKSTISSSNEEEKKTQMSILLDIVENEKDSYELMGEDNDKKLSFFQYFVTSDGPPQVTLVCLLLAVSIGCTVGVVPAVTTDRYARLNHGFDGDPCYTYLQNERPAECIYGSEDAQNVSAAGSFVSNFATFITSSMVGSISDARGRKPVLVIGICLSLVAPFILVLMQVNQDLNPLWYYAGGSLNGFINWTAIALSSLSDAVPPHWRAPSFGLFLSGFSIGFAFSPMLAVLFNHFGVSVLSFIVLVMTFFYVILFYPETLPKHIALETLEKRRIESAKHDTLLKKIMYNFMRPFRELSIINRNCLFRLLSALAFLSGVVASADQSLLLYYIEDRIGFRDTDVGLLFIILGITGVSVQAFLLKPLNDKIGERMVLVLAFTAGTITNILYGFARTKTTIYIGITLSSFLTLSFPTISAIKANNVDELEQGRIQGALYSLSSLASGLGPLSLRFIYHETKNNPYPGPGTMFLFAASLYFIAIFISICLPKHQANSNIIHTDEYVSRDIYDVDADLDKRTYGTLDSDENY